MKAKHALVKEDLLKEAEFFQKNQQDILSQVHSNIEGIKAAFSLIGTLVDKKITNMSQCIALESCLVKLNTYICMALLNEVQDNTLVLSKITRLPRLFFKLHMNKLKILQHLIIQGSDCRLLLLPSEIGYLQQLKSMEVINCGLQKLPKEIALLKNLEKINVQ